jgi:hypothetical protein
MGRPTSVKVKLHLWLVYGFYEEGTSVGKQRVASPTLAESILTPRSLKTYRESKVGVVLSGGIAS